MPGLAEDSCWHTLLDWGRMAVEGVDNRPVADMQVEVHSLVQVHTAVEECREMERGQKPRVAP